MIEQARALRPFVPISVREDLTWDEVSLIAVNTPDLPGRDARFRPAARVPARRDAGPRPGLRRARSTRPSRRRTPIRCCSCPSSGSARTASSAPTTRLCAAAPGSVAGRGQRPRPRDPRGRAPRGRARQRHAAQPRPRPAALLRRAPLRRARRHRRRDRRPHRRRPGPGLGAELRPQRLRRTASAAPSGRSCSTSPRTPAGQQVHPRPVPAGLDLQDDDRHGRRSRPA